MQRECAGPSGYSLIAVQVLLSGELVFTVFELQRSYRCFPNSVYTSGRTREYVCLTSLKLEFDVKKDDYVKILTKSLLKKVKENAEF